MCCTKIIFGILFILTIGVFVAQIIFGIHYIRKPVSCARSEFLTMLTLAGGCCSILSIVFFSCFCHGCGFRQQSSNPDYNELH